MPLPPLELEYVCARRLEQLCGRLLPLPLAPPAATPTPGLSTSHRLESRWVRTWAFETAEAAASWNDEWERVLSHPGRLHPALLNFGGAAIADPTLDLIARIAATVVHEEVRGGSPPPRVSPGWSFELVITHRYEAPSFSWRRETLVMEVSWSVLGAERQPLWCLEAAREYDLRRLPPNASRVLTATPRHDTAEVYTPA
jgi:hypothetical protein